MAAKMLIRIDADFVLRQGLKWSGQNYFVFELDSSHPLLRQPVEICSDFYVFCHWAVGGATILQEERWICTAANSLFAFQPGQTYCVNTSPGTVVRGVLVAPRFLERNNFRMELGEAMSLIFSNTPLYLSSNDSKRMQQLLLRLLHNNRQSRQSLFHDRLQKAGFLMYSYELGVLYQQHAAAATARRPPAKRSEVLYQNFLHLLRNYVYENRSVEFYASRLAVTPKHFSESIKEVAGRTAGQLIADTVVNEARGLLEDTQLSVQEISNRLHFPDQATFAKYFKKNTGLSPKYYRLSLLEKLRNAG